MRKLLFLLICFSLLFVVRAQQVPIVNVANNKTLSGDVYFCGGSIKLRAEAAKTNTSEYIVKNVAIAQLGYDGTPVEFPGQTDNQFSRAIPLPFTFSFYNKNYNSVVVGSNGRLLFGTYPEFNELFSDIYKDIYLKLPLPNKAYNRLKVGNSAEYPTAQIFNAYNDLRTSRSASETLPIYYKTIGNAPNRRFVVSFRRIPQQDGAKFNEMQFVLDEGTNIITLFTNEKGQSNDPNLSRAITGIQNENGENAVTGDRRNNENWVITSSDQNEAWQFTPSGTLSSTTKWYVNDVEAGIGETFDYTPVNNNKIKAIISYSDGTTASSDELIFKYLEEPIITINRATCGDPAVLSVSAMQNVTYSWINESGDIVQTGNSNTYTATVAGKYSVRVKSNFIDGCEKVSIPVKVETKSNLPPAVNLDKHYCSTNGEANKTINLFDIYPVGQDYSVEFFEGSTKITDPEKFVIQANSERHLVLKAKTTTGPECSVEKEFTIKFTSLPSEKHLKKQFCLGSGSIDAKDHLDELAQPFDKNLFTVEYSTDGTEYTSNSIFNLSEKSKIFIRFSVAGADCMTISTIDFSPYPKVTAKNITEQLPAQCKVAENIFDLTKLIPQINPSPDVMVTFHKTEADARAGINAVSNSYTATLGITTLFARVKSKGDGGCVAQNFPEVKLTVYPKPQLLKNEIAIKNCPGNRIYDLNTDVKTLVNPEHLSEVKYYGGNGQELTEEQIGAYDAEALGNNPYIKLIYDSNCSDTVAFSLENYTEPSEGSGPLTACAGADGYAVFDLNKIDFGVTGAKIDFFGDASHNNPIANPAAYRSSGGKVYVRITQGGKCDANRTVDLIVNQPPKPRSPINDKYFICYGETLTVDATSDDSGVIYSWSNGAKTPTATFDSPGEYSVTLTGANDCAVTYHFTVSDENQPHIDKINVNNNQIEVIASGGLPPYQFNFNGEGWQDSNFYTNPNNKEVAIQVRSKNGCAAAPKTFYVISTIPNVITPNGDGYNDTWTIPNLKEMNNVSIVIVDRYGKKVFESRDKNKLEWNGMDAGRPLPTASYWYVVKWEDPYTGQSVVRQGSILLKNSD